MKYIPHKYQSTTSQHILDHRRCGAFLDMGLGKSVSTLTAVAELIEGLEIVKVLVIAPKRVAEHTWPEEIRKWDHTCHLKYSVVAGDQRQRKMALMKKADIYIIGRDNVTWLVDYLGRDGWDFEMLVIDESSSFKNNQSQRFKSLRKVAHKCHRVVALTGTPAPQSLLDLWPQLYLIDKGERLGKTITQYREAYFQKRWNGFGYDVISGAEEKIHNRISDICISMTATDYLELPDRVDIDDYVHLEHMDKYREFVEEEVLKLDIGSEITPMSAAALYNKLLQFCNGAVYDEEKRSHIVDKAKLTAVSEAVEALQGQPVIIFYQFQSDVERLKTAIPQAQLMRGPETVEEWNLGKIPVLLGHAASMGHGLNMQYGGHHIFWYGLPWSLELYQQAVKRLDRQGQVKPVINRRFIAKDTVEEIVRMKLKNKAVTQNELIEALKKHVL